MNNNSNYVFSSSDTSFITSDIFRSMMTFGISAGLSIRLYLQQPHSLSLFLSIFLIIYPIPFLYYRWRLFKYNENSLLSINIETGTFTYKNRNNVFTFNSNDIEEWWYYTYGTTLNTYIDITELTLKDGKRVFLSSGIGNVNYFMSSHKKDLNLPEQNFGYSLKYLYRYMKEIGLLK